MGEIPAVDPTYVPVKTDDRRNPLVKRMAGWAHHGPTYFDVPFISEIVPGFYQGGCEWGLVVPQHIEYVVSLYPWEKYTLGENVKARFEFEAYDDLEGPGREKILEIANLVNDLRAKGTTLVHCQAGLNRSGLIAATSLILEGMPSDEAVDLLRNSRSPAVLCNPAFEAWVLRFTP